MVRSSPTTSTTVDIRPPGGTLGDVVCRATGILPGDKDTGRVVRTATVVVVIPCPWTVLLPAPPPLPFMTPFKEIDEGTNRQKFRGRHRYPGRIRRAVRLTKRGLKLKLLTRGMYLYIKNSQAKQLYGFFFCFSFNNDPTKNQILKILILK